MKRAYRMVSTILALALLCSLSAAFPVFAQASSPAGADASQGTFSMLSIDSYQIGTETAAGGEEGGAVTGSAFTPLTNVELYQSDLTIKVYFTYTGSWHEPYGNSLSGENFVQQGGSITAEPVAGSPGKGIVTFSGIKYNGPSNTIDFSIGGATKTLVIAECQIAVATPAPTVEPTPEPSPTPQPKTPGLILKESSFGGTSVAAGEPFDLTLTIYATDGGENLSDVMVTLGINDENVTLANGNLNVYLGEMAPGSTRQVVYQILPGANFTGGVAKFSVGLSGKGKSTGAAPTTDGSTSVSVPVTQPDRFEITNLEAPETIMVGEEGYLSLSFVNKGKMQVNNLSAELKGNMANPGQSQYLGNLAAGTENSVDFSLMANEAGTIEGTIVLSYEDAQGKVVALEKTFSCTVEESMGGGDMWMDPSMDPTMGMEVEEPSGGVPVFVWIILAVVVIGGGVAAVIIVRKKKAAKLAQLEDSDEDI